MTKRQSSVHGALVLGATLLVLLPAGAADWPCYRADVARSGVTTDTLGFPLSTNWIFHSESPRPAWPEPGRTANWFDFDYAFQPIAAGGFVYLASSSEDTLYALHAVDGRIAWAYTVDAPVRVAPHIADGRCVFAADDGVVYGLNANTGAALWTYRCFPDNRMVSGNGRMISRWPCRSGVVVVGNTVFGTAGMWPTEGVCIFALNAQTGEVEWLNDTVNADYMLYPHDALSFGGPTPQGALLCDVGAGVLLVPTGQSMPAGFKMGTGEFLYWEPRASGSTWATVTDGMALVAGRGWQTDQDTRLGEAGLWESDGIACYDTRDGQWNRNPKLAGYDKLPGTPRFGQNRYRGMVGPIGGRDRAVHANQVLYTSGMGVVEAVETSGNQLVLLWRKPAPRIYDLVVCGNALLCGRDGKVVALNLRDGETLWSATVRGQARGMAVTDGRLLVSTDRGVLYAFGAGTSVSPYIVSTVGEEQPGDASTTPSLPPGVDVPHDLKGYGLVVGCENTSVAEALAARSELHVICLLKGDGPVTESRKELLGKGYGTRITIHRQGMSGSLPYGDHFANAIIVNADRGGVEPAELYRVLQPCTGKLYLTGSDKGRAEAFMQEGGVPAAERVTGAIVPTVARGGLAGAFDWNSREVVDQRIKWPLELLWFGGPGRDRMLRRHGRWYPPPIPAHGRVYMQGESHVMAVDAYNGTELWSWYLPGFRSVYADDRHVYIRNERILKCDARTGTILGVYGNAQPFLFDLAKPAKFDVKPGNKYSGSITVAREGQAVLVRMETKTPTPHASDCWMLHFDFRNVEARLLPPAPGAFTVIVNTKTGTLRKYAGKDNQSVPDLVLSDAGLGQGVLSLRLQDDVIRQVAGEMPVSFDVRAELLLYEFGREAPQRRLRELPFTAGRDFMQNGTATFVLGGNGIGSMSPAAVVSRLDRGSLPAGADDWGRVPSLVRHDGNVPRLPYASELDPKWRLRIESITGENSVRRYQRGYGCSGTISSSCMDFFRSGTLGMYDLADDSGMRNFAGVKPGCGVALLPALGVLISGESNADCFCPYNFATSLALAPARERRHEDWALFFDEPKLADVKRVTLNIAAPGDRRAQDGSLWMGYPRQPLMDVKAGAMRRAHTFSMPFALQTFEGAHPVRVNADRVPISGTDVPWVYASGLIGIRQMSLGLVYFNPRTECLALPVTEVVTIDGCLKETSWSEDTGIPLETRQDAGGANARLRMRYDANCIYLGYEEDAGPRPWSEGVKAYQGDIWRDDHVSVSFKDTRLPLCLQVGHAVGGGRYAADVSWRIRVPRMSAIAVDGNAADWGGKGLHLSVAEERGSMRVGWTPAGLAVLTVLPEGFFSYQKSWNALRVQVVSPADATILETVIQPTKKSFLALKAMPLRNDDGSMDADRWESLRRSEPVDMPVAWSQAEDSMVCEALFPWDSLGLAGIPRARCGLKVTAFDPESKDGNVASGGGSRKDILRGELLCVLELAANTNVPPVRVGGTRRDWYGSVMLFEPSAHSIPSEAWTSAVTTNAAHFQCEMAIPLAVLSSAGLSLDRLDIAVRPPFRVLPRYDSMRMVADRGLHLQTGSPGGQKGRYTVRLHFAELSDAGPGTRVFDIRLQGRTVAKALDVVAETGGTYRALTREFSGIEADKVMHIEWMPCRDPSGKRALPIVNGIELIREE